jgi:hypothetical protein
LTISLLNEKATPQQLGMARIVVFSLWIPNLLYIRLPDYASLPLELLHRHGALRLIPDFVWSFLFAREFLILFQLGVLACVVWLILGLPRYRLVAIATCILLILFDGMFKSIDTMHHGQFGILYAAWILAAFPAADAVALAPRRGPRAADAQYAAPMFLIPAVLLVAYGFMGALRIDRNGLDLFGSEALQYWFAKNSLFPPSRLGFDLGVVVASTPWMLVPMQIGFGVVTLFELLSPVCLVSRTFRWIWLWVMVPFHLLSALLLNILFWENVGLILFFMTDIHRVFAPRVEKDEPSESPQYPKTQPTDISN